MKVDEENGSLRESVYNELKKSIAAAELKPGDRLQEKRLAEKMGVSRTPVREAIRKLEQEGKVQLISNKGAEVASLDLKDLSELMVIRRDLLGLAIYLAVQNAQDSELKEFEGFVNEMQEALDKDDVQMLRSSSRKIVDRTCELANNHLLSVTLKGMMHIAYFLSAEYILKAENRPSVKQGYQEILQEVLRKNPGEARKCLERNIAFHEEALLRSLE